MSIREEQCNKVCRILDDVLANRTTERDSLIVAVRKAFEQFGNSEPLPSVQPEPIKINIDDFNKEDLERFKKELGNTPITVLPAQPEIIRCRNCKFASGDSRICMKFGHSPIGELDFCAWAERRTDE